MSCIECSLSGTHLYSAEDRTLVCASSSPTRYSHRGSTATSHRFIHYSTLLDTTILHSYFTAAGSQWEGVRAREDPPARALIKTRDSTRLIAEESSRCRLAARPPACPPARNSSHSRGWSTRAASERPLEISRWARARADEMSAQVTDPSNAEQSRAVRGRASVLTTCPPGSRPSSGRPNKRSSGQRYYSGQLSLNPLVYYTVGMLRCGRTVCT